MSEPQQQHESVGEGRLFEVVDVTEDDLHKAGNLPADACPRRYCWWWASLSFDWNAAVKEGCTVVESTEVPPKYRHVPCCRSDRSSDVDHFEPRLPHILDDGIDASRWLKFRFERDREGLLNLKRILEGSEANSLRNLAIALLALSPTPTTDWKSALMKWIEDMLVGC
jgi:hypothetical protein